jgi:hypothetical protein
MNRIILIEFLVLCLLFAACSEESKVKEKHKKNEHIGDSLVIVPNREIIEPNHALDSLLSLFSNSKSIPFQIKSKEIEGIVKGKKLRRKQVNMLAANISKNDLFMDVDYAVKNFNTIDSVKAKGRYDEWKSNVGLGQIMYSQANALAKIELQEKSYLLFWILDYQTEDACPFSYSKTIYVTSVYKNKIIETIIFAKQSGGGDAPISFDKSINGAINTDTTIVLSLREEHDYDEPKIELTEANYELKLELGKIIFIKEEKQKPKKIKRKV